MAPFGGGRPAAVSRYHFHGRSVEVSPEQPSRCDHNPRRWHDDGSKKRGDNIGFNGHKKIKGDKVVAFCDRNCNVIAPFVAAPGNHSESPLLRAALPNVMRIARSVGLEFPGNDRQPGRCLRLPAEPKGDLQSRHAAQHQCQSQSQEIRQAWPEPLFNADIFKERFDTIERRVLAGRISSAACCCGSSASVSYNMRIRRLHIRRST